MIGLLLHTFNYKGLTISETSSIKRTLSREISREFTLKKGTTINLKGEGEFDSHEHIKIQKLNKDTWSEVEDEEACRGINRENSSCSLTLKENGTYRILKTRTRTLCGVHITANH